MYGMWEEEKKNRVAVENARPPTMETVPTGRGFHERNCDLSAKSRLVSSRISADTHLDLPQVHQLRERWLE
ncbi:hypothetical protein TNCV_3053101 [Trichonephila clavipes]|uniref:Uncharacterized protein n=1 Tax=Trichonephila clavipes TaxID=2585209 RepID=A0A8X6RRG8_TRICX|nr:hypothetical protein TNCV_3053101 [Trichonephila clavipes]